MGPLPGDIVESAPETASIADELASKLKAKKEPSRPSIPLMEPSVDRYDVEPEIDQYRQKEMDSIRSDRDESQKRIQTKKLLSKLIDAAGLAYGASQGVAGDIVSADIDTSMDEYNMKQDDTSARQMMRDKIAQLRAGSQQKYRDDKGESAKKQRYKWAKYDEAMKLYDEQISAAEGAEKQRLKDEKQKKTLEFKREQQALKVKKVVDKEKDKLKELITQADDDTYTTSGFIDKLDNMLPGGLSEEDKKELTQGSAGTVTDLEDLDDWYKRKARRIIDKEMSDYGVDDFLKIRGENEQEKIWMMAPDGDREQVSPENVEYYKSKGATIIE